MYIYIYTHGGAIWGCHHTATAISSCSSLEQNCCPNRNPSLPHIQVPTMDWDKSIVLDSIYIFSLGYISNGVVWDRMHIQFKLYIYIHFIMGYLQC